MILRMNESYFEPEWPLPPNVRALVTTRLGGVSTGAYDSNNLALHVDDDPLLVLQNRESLKVLSGVRRWAWLNQTHSSTVVTSEESLVSALEADASITSCSGVAAVVMTADCVPILLCDSAGSQVAAVHAGWRGFLRGVLNHTIERFSAPVYDLTAYIGPAISRTHFEVGIEVIEAFDDYSRKYFSKPLEDEFFEENRSKRFQLDLMSVVRELLLLSLIHI